MDELIGRYSGDLEMPEGASPHRHKAIYVWLYLVPDTIFGFTVGLQYWSSPSPTSVSEVRA